MLRFKPYAHYFIVLGLAIFLTGLGQFSQEKTAWAEGTYFQTVPTRTPTPGPESDDDDDDNDSNTQNQSEIRGVVTDLSTEQPGVGVTVSINNAEVQTDSQGKYSLSGLGAGSYSVQVMPGGDAVPAQEPVTVQVDGQGSITVDLGYYSNPADANMSATVTPVAPTPTVQVTVAMTETTITTSAVVTQTVQIAQTTTQNSNQTQETVSPAPQALPQSGGSLYSAWLVIGLGFFVLGMGLKLNNAQVR